MSTDTIEAIFFDFGGVFTHSPMQALVDYAQSLNMDPLKLGRLVFGDYGSNTDHSWHRLERGEIGFAQAAAEIKEDARRAGLEIDLAESFKLLGGGEEDIVRHDFVEKAKELGQKGYKLGLITNNIVEYRNEWRKLFDVEGIFDEIVDSSCEGVRKPDPAIYRLAMDRLETVPGRSVFLDDIDSNLSPAQDLGMHTILVTTDSASVFSQLDDMLAGKQD